MGEHNHKERGRERERERVPAVICWLLATVESDTACKSVHVHEEHDAAGPHVHSETVIPARAREHLGRHVKSLPAWSLSRQRPGRSVRGLDAQGQSEVDKLHNVPLGQQQVFQAHIPDFVFRPSQRVEDSAEYTRV